jgi:hypothetical protein
VRRPAKAGRYFLSSELLSLLGATKAGRYFPSERDALKILGRPRLPS